MEQTEEFGNRRYLRSKAPTWGKEATGYATQKPLAVLKRIFTASSNPGDLVLDFFAGSGTTGVAANALGRSVILADNNEEAMKVMAKRFDGVRDVEFVGFDPKPYQLNVPSAGLRPGRSGVSTRLPLEKGTA